MQGTFNRSAFTLFEKILADSGCTIGDRSSAIYPRIYDWAMKHLGETKHDIWRYEIELKEEAAINAWEKWKVADDPAKLCAQMVNSRLKKHGLSEKAFDVLEPCIISGTKPPTTDENRLKWLNETICPIIAGLAERGHRHALLTMFLNHGLIDGDGVLVRGVDLDTWTVGNGDIIDV